MFFDSFSFFDGNFIFVVKRNVSMSVSWKLARENWMTSVDGVNFFH